jgi:beta-phosphoglucomutase-like phosphatase (HAD superfamily)
MPALIFDCDGVLADTERYGHLPAFNATFREFGLPVQWSEEDYGRLLQIAGGKERMASSMLTPGFVAAAGLPADPAGLAAEVARWHRRKTEIYTAMVADGNLPARPGIQRIIAAAQDAGWKMAVCIDLGRASVRAILENAAGPERAARFDLVLAGDVVAHKKPAPTSTCSRSSGSVWIQGQVLVIEDSRNGLEAATGAGCAAS